MSQIFRINYQLKIKFVNALILIPQNFKKVRNGYLDCPKYHQ